jgi:hypothetical protein
MSTAPTLALTEDRLLIQRWRSQPALTVADAMERLWKQQKKLGNPKSLEPVMHELRAADRTANVLRWISFLLFDLENGRRVSGVMPEGKERVSGYTPDVKAKITNFLELSEEDGFLMNEDVSDILLGFSNQWSGLLEQARYRVLIQYNLLQWLVKRTGLTIEELVSNKYTVEQLLEMLKEKGEGGTGGAGAGHGKKDDVPLPVVLWQSALLTLGFGGPFVAPTNGQKMLAFHYLWNALIEQGEPEFIKNMVQQISIHPNSKPIFDEFMSMHKELERFQHADLKLAQQITVLYQDRNRVSLDLSEPGTGKTRPAVAASLFFDYDRVGIIAPRRTWHGWRQEIKRFHPDAKVYSVKERLPKSFDHRAFVLITPELFQQRNKDKYVQRMVDLDLNQLITDELQLFTGQGLRNDTEEKLRLRQQRYFFLIDNIPASCKVHCISATPVRIRPQEFTVFLERLLKLDLGHISAKAGVATGYQLREIFFQHGVRFYNDDKMPVLSQELLEFEVTKEELAEIQEAEGELAKESILTTIKIRFLLKHHPELFRQPNSSTLLFTNFVGTSEQEESSLISKLVAELPKGTLVVTGERDDLKDENNDFTVEPIIRGNYPPIACSRTIINGINGLQTVSNTIIPVGQFRTYADFEQGLHRIYRQGSVFESVNVVFVVAKNVPYDRKHFVTMQDRRTFHECLMDGETTLPMPDDKEFDRIYAELQKKFKPYTVQQKVSPSQPLPPLKKGKMAKDVISMVHRDFSVQGVEFVIKRLDAGHYRFGANGYTYDRNGQSMDRRGYVERCTLRSSHWDRVPAEHFVENYIKEHPELVWADIGCGLATPDMDLPNRAYFVDSLINWHPKIKSEFSWATSIPTGECDIVSFIMSLYGGSVVKKDIAYVLKQLVEARRILKPGGRLVIVKSDNDKWVRKILPTLLGQAGFRVPKDQDTFRKEKMPYGNGYMSFWVAEAV